MKRSIPIITAVTLAFLPSCHTLSTGGAGHSSAVAENTQLSANDVLYLIEDKKMAHQKSAPLRSSPRTYDMVDGLMAYGNNLVPSYIRLLKKTKGNGVFSDYNDPRAYVEAQLSTATRAAQLAYEERRSKGLDGTAGKLDAPAERLLKLSQLIEQEVEFHTPSSVYSSWKKQWDAIDNL